MLNRSADPRTADRIVYELIRRRVGIDVDELVGTATFSAGTVRIEADEEIQVAVRELLARPFVDRVQADERPRGYRRSRQGEVDLLVPGMPEHFIARMRGLWMSYPDGSVITAREPGQASGLRAGATAAAYLPEPAETVPPIVDPAVRRASLARADQTAGGRPLVRPHAPLTGERPMAPGTRRTDCGWIV
jgi:hypothetical protein